MGNYQLVANYHLRKQAVSSMQALADLAHKTTCHGILDWYQAKNCSTKIVWSAVIVCAFGAIVYYECSLFSFYLTTPTATKLSRISASKLQFPTVTVCNVNAYSKYRYLGQWDKIKPYLIPTEAALVDPFQFLGYLTFATISSGNRDYLNASLTTHFQDIFDRTGFDVKDFLTNSSFPCGDMLDGCQFDFSDTFSCCKDSIASIGWMGNCFTVLIPLTNETHPPMQSQSGRLFGFIAKLLFNTSDIPKYCPEDVSVSEGFSITIGEPMSTAGSLEVLVGPKTVAHVSLSLNRYVYDDGITICTKTAYPVMYTQMYTESRSICNQECQINSFVRPEFCGCSPIFANSDIPNRLLCTPDQALYCVGVVSANDTFRSIVYQCMAENCPKRCVSSSFVPFVLYNAISSKINLTGTDIQPSFVYVYYGEIMFIEMEEKLLLDLAGLISGFGGNLGLFTGMSIITVVQFFSHTIFAVVTALQKYWNTYKQNQLRKAIYTTNEI